MSSSIGFRIYLRIRRLLSKCYASVQLDQQQNHLTPFVDYFSNPTGEGGKLIIQIDLFLHYSW